MNLTARNKIHVAYPVARLALAACLVFSSTARGADPREAEVRSAFSNFMDSWFRYDVAAAERLVADDFVWVSQGGKYLGKPDWVRSMKEQRIGNEFQREVLKIRIFGEVGFVHYVDLGKNTKTIRTIAFAKSADGLWRVVLHHATPGEK